MEGIWKAVLRDVFLIFLLTFLGGFVIGLVIGITGARSENIIIASAISNLLFATVGFAIAGCLVSTRRWKHLTIVAVLVWIGSLVNVILFGVPLASWLISAVFIVVAMLLGGGISFLIVRPKPVPALARAPAGTAEAQQAGTGRHYMSMKEWMFSIVGSVIAGLITAGLTNLLSS